MKKKGFTMIEMLACLVLVGLLAVIASPIVTGSIDRTKMDAFKSSVDGLIRTIKNDQTGVTSLDDREYIITNGVIKPELTYEGEISGNGFIRVDYEGKTHVQIFSNGVCLYKNKFDKYLKVGRMTEEECNKATNVSDKLEIVEGTLTTDSATVIANFKSNKIAKEFYFKIAAADGEEEWVSNQDKKINYYKFKKLQRKTYSVKTKVVTTDGETYESDSLILNQLPVAYLNVEISPTTLSSTKTVKIDFGAISNRYVYRYKINNEKFVIVTTPITTLTIKDNNTNIFAEVLDENRATILSVSKYIDNISK